MLVACGGGGSGSSQKAADPPPASSTPPPASAPPPTTPAPTNPTTPTDVVTYKNDNARTGKNLSESVLTLANVNQTNFGLLRVLTVDGKVDAQPLYLSKLSVGTASRSVVFVATEHDSVYAFDADTGDKVWQASLLATGESTSDNHGCGQVTPEIGITATPVIDRSAGPHGVIYVVGMSKDGSSVYHQRLHALDVTTGAEMFGGPVEVSLPFQRPAAPPVSAPASTRSAPRCSCREALSTRRGHPIATRSLIPDGSSRSIRPRCRVRAC